MILLWVAFIFQGFLVFVFQNFQVSCEVTLIKAEIKRNNVTIPDPVEIQPKTNSTLPNNEKQKKDEIKTQKESHRKSEVYVVNNGLLFLHPKKIENVSGVKKSTEPVPPAINYHVIKKLKSNSSNPDIATKILENHVRKRSVTKSHSKIRTNGKVELGPLDWDKTKELGNHGRKSFIRKTKDRKKLLKTKKTLIENPLYDNEQSEEKEKKYIEEIKSKLKKRSQDKKSKLHQINKIPNIRKDFDKLENVPQYPRFGIHHLESSLFPRFPIHKLSELEYPRFPVKSLGDIEFPRFPKYPKALHEYPRDHKAKTQPEFPEFEKKSEQILEFPRFEEKSEQFKEFPRFEQIKPLNLQNFPEFEKFPEATAIPEIKPIGDAEKKSRTKRGDYADKKDDSDDEANDFGDNEDDNDDDDEDDNDRDDNNEENDLVDNSYNQIQSIASIPHIQRPASIPSIPDIPSIPVLPLIPALHPIHGIKPIPDLKSIPQASNADSRTMQESKDQKTTFQNEKVDVKSIK